MKINIEYESETLLPKEIDDLIMELEKNINDNKYEPEKINCFIIDLKIDLIMWIKNHRKDKT